MIETTSMQAALMQQKQAEAEAHEYSPMPDVSSCIKALVRHGCKVHQAAVDLNVRKEDFVLFLVAHKAELSNAIEAITLLDALDALSTAQAQFKSAITDDDVPLPEILKAYNNLLGNVGHMVAPKQVGVGGSGTNIFTGNISIEQQVLEALEPEDRQAVLHLVELKRQQQRALPIAGEVDNELANNDPTEIPNDKPMGARIENGKWSS